MYVLCSGYVFWFYSSKVLKTEMSTLDDFLVLFMICKVFLTSDGSNYVRSSMFDRSKPKIGCPSSISKRWTRSSSFNVQKMMFEFVWCSIKWCSTHHWYCREKNQLFERFVSINQSYVCDCLSKNTLTEPRQETGSINKPRIRNFPLGDHAKQETVCWLFSMGLTWTDFGLPLW